MHRHRHLLLPLAVVALTLLPSPISACLTSSDCAGFPCTLPPTQSSSNGTCACPSTRYESDGTLSLDSLNPTCSSSLSSLYPALFLAHRVVLLVLYSLLFILALALGRRLRLADQPGVGASTYPLLACTLVAISQLVYNAVDPMGAGGVYPAAASSFFLLFGDALCVAGYVALFAVVRDVLLMSPVIADEQYNALVKTERVVWTLRSVAVVPLLVLLAAVWLREAAAPYFAVTVAVVVGFSGYLLATLYGLASNDQKATRRVSVLALPATVYPVPVSPKLPAVENSAMLSDTLRTSTTLGGTHEDGSISLQPSTLTHLSPRPSASPHSTDSAVHAASAPIDHRLSSHVQTWSVAQQPCARSARKVSVVVSASDGQKPIKAYSVERYDMRRLIRVQLLLAAGLVAMYCYLLSAVSGEAVSDAPFFAASMNGRTAIIVQLVKGGWTWLWCCALLAAIWPTAKAVTKARSRRQRRSQIHLSTKALESAAKASAAGSRRASDLHSPVVKQTPHQPARSLAVRGRGAAQGAEDTADSHPHTMTEHGAGDEEDEDLQAEESRELAIALMSTAVAHLPTGGSRTSLAMAVSQSPSSSPYQQPLSASTPPRGSINHAHPTSLLEPASVFPFPGATGLTATRPMPVRHSLPAIHVDPLILSRVMNTLTEPNTPNAVDAHGPGLMRQLSPPGDPRLETPFIARSVSESATLSRPTQGSPESARPSIVRHASDGSGRLAAAAMTSSSRAVRPDSASANSVSGGGLMGLGGVGAGGGWHERDGSRASSIMREAISPRTSSSKGTRQQRIFAPSSAALEG